MFRILAPLGVAAGIGLIASTPQHADHRVSTPVPAAVSRTAELPAGVVEGWWGEMRATLEASEYEASVTDAGLQAPNRAQNLRTFFGPSGIELIRRTEVEPRWRWGWQTRYWGRLGSLQPVCAVEPSWRGARVTYDRGDLVEWYENRQEGLEQGFTVLRPPEGDGRLCLEGVLSGRSALGASLRADADPEGRHVTLGGSAGEPWLQYGDLSAFDASGRSLSARIEPEQEIVRILVDDANATYPITIDPLFRDPEWTIHAPVGGGGAFGFCVGTAGDINADGFSDLLVGAPDFDGGQTDEGRILIFLGGASGPGVNPVWTAESNQTNARFGISAALAGDVNNDGYPDIVASAPEYDHGQVDEGAVFAWYGSSTGLGPTGNPGNADWMKESNQANADYGYSVSSAGDVNDDGYDDVIVGARLYDGDVVNEGAAFVYRGTMSGLGSSAYWMATSDVGGSNFGLSVACVGDVNGDGYDDVCVGADEIGPANSGGAYAWYGSASGLGPYGTPANADWLAFGDDLAGFHFGRSVSTAGDVNGDGYADVIIGAPNLTSGETDEGGLYAYYGSSTGLPLMYSWLWQSDQAGALAGRSVATAGDWNADGYADVILGAPSWDGREPGNPVDGGAAILLFGTPGGLSATAKMVFEGGTALTDFGWAVATSGDVNGDGFSDIIIGVPYKGPYGGEAALYAGMGSAPAWLSAGAWGVEAGQMDAHLGTSVACAGDVNGDGYSDLLVGAPDYDLGYVDEGAAWLYLGSRNGPVTPPAWLGHGSWTNAHFGQSVAGAGDINGDGYSDVIIGAPTCYSGEIDEGIIAVFYGSASGLPPGGTPGTADWCGQGNQVNAQLGISVGTAGDVNGDGYSDIIAGAHLYTSPTTNEGAVFVWHGSATGLAGIGTPTNADWRAESNMVSALFGFACGTAGDVNGDGYSDVIVGAYNTSSGQNSEGRAYSWYGGPDGLGTDGSPANADWVQEPDLANARFGYSLEPAGDVNGDGYSDVVVGAYSWTDGIGSGAAYVYEGSPTGLETTAVWESHFSPGLSTNYGYAVSGAGDVDGDGYCDILVGANLAETAGFTNEGLAYLYCGSEFGPSASFAWAGRGGVNSAQYGAAVSGAGDVNGDGFADILIGAPRYTSGQAAEGRVSVLYGNDHATSGDGLERLAQQARVDDAAPIDLLGVSDSETSFRLRALGRTPAGRGRVRLQWEVKPLGVAFDGNGLGIGSEFDTGTPNGSGSAIPLSERVSGLTLATRYHWRSRILTDSPLFPHSRWFSPPGNGPCEVDVRTASSQSGVPSPGDQDANRGVSLAPCAPSPFTTATRISYSLLQDGHVRLAVYDVAGREVRTLLNGRRPSGRSDLIWDGVDQSGLPACAGTYFVRLSVGEVARIQKIQRVR